jgi:hypothetical protein
MLEIQTLRSKNFGLAPFRLGRALPRPAKPRRLAQDWRRLAKQWRALPMLGRVRLVIRQDATNLQITEIRLKPVRLTSAQWVVDEPGAAVALRAIRIEPGEPLREENLLMCTVGLHALARRFERAEREDGAVLRDLREIGLGWPRIMAKAGEFRIPLSGGVWRGGVTGGPAKTMAVRTFVDG